MKKIRPIAILTVVFILITCGLVFNSCSKKNDCQHKFGEWQEEVAPTCEKDGVLAHKACTLCYKNFDEEGKEIDDIVISALGGSHSYIDAYDVTCENCGAVNAVTNIVNLSDKTVIYFADGKKVEIETESSAEDNKCTHSDENAAIYLITAHTIDEDGVYLRECKANGCPAPLSLVSKTEHGFDVEYIVDEGKNLCADGGLKRETCSVCAKVVDTEILPAEDNGIDGVHTVSDDAWTVVTVPEHIIPGKKSGACAVCGLSVEAEIPGSHDFEYALRLDDSVSLPVPYEKREDVCFILTKTCKYNGCTEVVEEQLSVSQVTKISTYEPTCSTTGIYVYGYEEPNGSVQNAVSVTIDCCMHAHSWIDGDENENKLDFKLNDKFTVKDCGTFIDGIEGFNCREYTLTTLLCDKCEQNVNVYVIADHEFEYELSISGDSFSVVAPNGCINDGCDGMFDVVTLEKEAVDIETVQPTCEKDGSVTYKYTYEGKELTFVSTLVKLQHVLNGEDMYDNTVYVFDEVQGLKKFDNVELSCATVSDVYFVCDSCEKIVNAKARAVHAVNLAWNVTLAPTCDTDGEKSGYCKNCNTDGCVEKIPATGHSYNYTYSEENATILVDCEKCDATDYELVNCVLDLDAGTEATCKEEGKNVYVGENSEGETVTVVEVIPKAAHLMPTAVQNERGAYLYDEACMTLFADDAIFAGETSKAVYVCPECGAKILIDVYLPSEDTENE